MTMLDRALYLESLHLSVFPLAPRSKTPPAEWKDHQTWRATREAITGWWSNGGADQNIAVACGPVSGVFVVDIDGAEGEASLAALEAEYGPMPKTWRVKTARGRHYWFKDSGLRNTAGKLGNHIDTRGDGGLVVAPGSVHPTGALYDWEPGFDPEFTELAELPAWVAERLTAAPKQAAPAKILDFNSAPRQRSAIDNREAYRVKQYLNALLDGAANDLARTPQGQRNQTLNDKAMWLGHFAHYDVFNEEQAWLALAAACVNNGEWNDPDGGEKRCRSTFQSGWKAGSADQRNIPDGDRPPITTQSYVSPAAKNTVEATSFETGEILDDIRFKLIRYADVKPNLTSRYLVKGLIPSESLVIAWGPPKCGKSFWFSDVALHLAAGKPYRGLKVRSGPVVYIAAEGASGFMARVHAWKTAHAGDGRDVPFHILPMRVDLVQDCAKLIADIGAQVGGAMPVLVVIDTLNRTFTGSESADEDMTAYVKAADAIKEAFGCSTAVIHHCGIDGTRPRGHTSLTGAADTQIQIQRDGSGLILAKVEWMKDGPEDYENKSRLEVVEIGLDEDGDAVTTCVINASADEPEDPKAKLSAPLYLALVALKTAVGEMGEVSGQSHIPSSAKCVPVAVWRRFYNLRSVGEEADKETQAARQKAFKRASTELLARGIVGSWNDLVWVCKDA